jgi:hypothetical protein
MADFSRGWSPKISSPEPETPWQRRSQPRPRKASFAVKSRVSRLRRALLRRFQSLAQTLSRLPRRRTSGLYRVPSFVLSSILVKLKVAVVGAKS